MEDCSLLAQTLNDGMTGKQSRQRTMLFDLGIAQGVDSTSI
jgi:hypothetical protein